MSYTRNKTGAELDAISQFLKGVPDGDDKGLGVKGGQFSVGSPVDPQESVFGEGDSYPVPIAFLCDIANTTDLTITGAADVSTILQSDSGSTSGLFGGTTAGKYLLIGSPYSYGGVKVKIDTAGDAAAGNVMAEYLQDNTPVWEEANYMVSQSDFPYLSKSNVLASESGSEQWRFGFDAVAGIPTWELVTMNINGVDYEYRWARIKIVTDITTDPILEQMKLHTNRHEVNADGFTEYFGRARYPKDLTMHWELTVQQQGFSPSNENIDFASNLSLVFQDNEFSAGATDGRGGYIVLPSGIDTSIPLYLEALWIPEGSGSGDVKYNLLTIPKRIGDLMDSTEAANSQSELISLDNQLHELQRTILKVDISSLNAGEILGFAVQRLGGDSEDTFTSTISMINIRAVGYFWKP